MTLNRIQKLLFTEYNDFEDHVLLECPFAQTTRDGEGIQQLHIGLTPTKLILAKDFIEWKNDPADKEDPVVGTLELISMLPVEFVNLSIYRRKTRKTIKAQFCNQRVLYFELATSFRREMFWNLWCERMTFLCPADQNSTSSDSSNDSSSSCSVINVKTPNVPKMWEERNLYFGNKFISSNTAENVKETTHFNTSDMVDYGTNSRTDSENIQSVKCNQNDYQRVCRFGTGIEENCVASLYLPTTPSSVAYNDFSDIKSTCITSKEENRNCYQMLCLAEKGVHIWQKNFLQPSKTPQKTSKITPFGSHLSGYGHENFTKGNAFSIQIKRNASEINLREIPEEMKIDLPKRVLVSSASCECLPNRCSDNDAPPLRRNWRYIQTIGQDIFWMPKAVDYSTPTSKLYGRVRKHLNRLHDFRKRLGVLKQKSVWTRLKRPPIRNPSLPVRPTRSYNTLRKELQMDISLSSWDFDSTILSYQLTLLDRDFFLKISPKELHSLLTEHSSNNSPNVKLIIDFADRIANLIVTEIVRLDSLKMRARLVGKYINLADKLHRLHNMHSTHSVLCGLTLPAVYRLSETWSYIKRHHYSKYKRLNTLLKLYKDVRSPLYCKMFDKCSSTPPYLPSIKCLIYGILGHLPTEISLKNSKSYHSLTSSSWSIRRRLSLWRTQSAGGSLNSESTRSSILSDSSDFSHDEPNSRQNVDEYCDLKIRFDAAKASLKLWQQAATTYDLIGSPLVKEFLLRAKYLEPCDNFFFSLRMEPGNKRD